MKSVILLVDDNLIQAATRKAVLERTGQPVLVASDGQTAIEMLTSLDSPLDIGLIVTDHLMPGMSGLELVMEVRQRGYSLPIIVLSGLPDAETAYGDLGVTFRLKPFPPDSLIALTRQLLPERMPRTA